MDVDRLAPLLIRARGSMGIRAAAKEIGISPTTLSRIERGHVPDLKTLGKVCEWIGEDPTKFTGIGGLQIAFTAAAPVSMETATSLASLIVLASAKFAGGVGHA